MAENFRQSPRRILVRGVNWLGDAVMTTPALIRLRERFPEARITLLTPEKLCELWQHHPAVDETIGFEPEEGLLSVSRKLRVGRFDFAVVLPNSPRSALEVWLAGVPRRVGYARPWRNWFLTQAVHSWAGHVKMAKLSLVEIQMLIVEDIIPINANYTKAGHQTNEYLNLVAALGAPAEPMPPSLVVTAAEEEAVARKFGLIDALRDAKPILALNPGAEYGPAKRWPVGQFIVAANEIQKQTNCVWLIVGGKGDQSLAEQIAGGVSGSMNLAGKTSLRELMALLKLCRVLLTNDTGPMHVAAALDTPVVVPFGSTSPELTGPGLPGDSRHRLLKSGVPCSPCFLRECPIDFRCMEGITVERVTAATLELLGA